MSLATEIAPQIPFLRRYARALTGSQVTGDGYVAALLEALVADPDLYNAEYGPRVAIYRLFSRLWRRSAQHREGAASGSTADARIRALTPLSRQAFLLTAVEGFSPAEAADVLDVDTTTMARLLDDAGREIAEQMATRVLIIEDEPIIAMELEDLVASLGHGVTGNARTHREAIELVAAERPGLVLADIRLADGSSGLEAVNEILAGFDVPVVFITAYPEFLLTGERPEPTFLVTKPFRDEMLRAVVAQALFFDLRPGGGDRSPASPG